MKQSGGGFLFAARSQYTQMDFFVCGFFSLRVFFNVYLSHLNTHQRSCQLTDRANNYILFSLKL